MSQSNTRPDRGPAGRRHRHRGDRGDAGSAGAAGAGAMASASTPKCCRPAPSTTRRPARPSPRAASARRKRRMPSCSAPWAGPASARRTARRSRRSSTCGSGCNLYAGVRPVRAIPGVPVALADPRARDIDLVLIRESTEGLFHSRGKGLVTADYAEETLRITRADDREAVALRLPAGASGARRRGAARAG